jgi:hypothetical protein
MVALRRKCSPHLQSNSGKWQPRCIAPRPWADVRFGSKADIPHHVMTNVAMINSDDALVGLSANYDKRRHRDRGG